jgi:hypothetical protein
VNVTRVRFSAQVSAGCSSPRWTWDLGDGTSVSAEPSLATSAPSHVYQQPGEYQVVVTAECAEGTPARGFLRMFARSFTGTWLRNGFLDGHEGIYHLVQSGATLQGDCNPCFPDEQDAFVGPVSGSIEAASDDQVTVRWRQGQVDTTITVLKPYDYIYTCVQQPRPTCFSLVRQP